MVENFKIYILLVYIFLPAFIVPSTCFSQTITAIQNINFGEAVLLNNNSQHIIEINANGAFSIDPAFLTVINPVRGEYIATGLPAGIAITNITVSVDQHLVGAGRAFTIDNFDIDAPSNASGTGDLPILLGARLMASGTGIRYADSTNFNGLITITVDY